VRVVEQVRDALASRTTLRIRAAGTWLQAGRPVRAAAMLSLADDRGIVEYVPGDLTLTARAGTPLAEIAGATAEHAQWLPLDPWGNDEGTIGACVSTGTTGPHAYAMGLPRDTVLGLEFVTGSGDTVRAGGRVVKNVAGFDLTRLLIGSWGTLGVITEVTVRLRARPEATQTLAIAVAPAQVSDLAPKLRGLPFTPLASELLNETLAAKLGLGSEMSLLIHLGGNERSVRAQRDLLGQFGEAREMSGSIWGLLRAAVDGSATWRWSQLPARFGETWSAAMKVSRTYSDTLIHGNPARGVARIAVRDATTIEPSALATATGFAGTVAHEVLPADVWQAIDARPANDAVSRAIRRKFDPGRILNAGILGEDA
jgi:glycolate dehydrogenase FAD-binding subunit